MGSPWTGPRRTRHGLTGPVILIVLGIMFLADQFLPGWGIGRTWPVLLIVLGVFGISLYRGQGELEARALTFTTLIVANLGLILTNRSWSRTILSTLRSPNTALWWVLGGAAIFLGAVLYVPVLRDLFRLSTLHLMDLVICFCAGVVSIMWFEGLKMVNGWKRRTSPIPDSPYNG